MIVSEHYQHYAVLLQIRQTAARRNSIILGTVWAVGMLAVFLSNFYGAPNTQSIFLTNVILIAIGLGFVFNLLRFEIFSHLSDLVDFLQRES